MSTQVKLRECGSCARRWQTRYAGCPYCGSPDVGDVDVSGDGRIYSWVGVHRAMSEDGFAVPYHVLTVELDAGARIFARLVSDNEPLADQRVTCRTEMSPGGTPGMVAEIV